MKGVVMPHDRIVPASLLLLAALPLAACGHSGGPLLARDTVEEIRAIEPHGRFELENVNGRITVTTWNRNEVSIQAERAAVNEEALERLKVEIRGEGDEVRVETRYPRRRHWFMGGNPGKVDYEITLPPTVRVRLKTVNGPVDVEGLATDLQARSVNGPLDIRDVRGEVRAQTVNGPIHVTFEGVPPDGHHEMKTVNGGISIAIPRQAGGRLTATTVNGSIDCDRPLDVTIKKKRHLEGRLGPGSGAFDLSTVNGGIDVVDNPAARPAEAPEP
jgi:hypothetical protein